MEILGNLFISNELNELQKSSLKQIEKVGIFGDEKIIAIAGTTKKWYVQEWPHILITNKRIVIFDRLNVHQYLYNQISNILIVGYNELPQITLNNGLKRDIFGTFKLGMKNRELVKKIHLHLQEQWIKSQ